MVDVALKEGGESRSLIFENRDIRAMVESLHRPVVQGYPRTNPPRT